MLKDDLEKCVSLVPPALKTDDISEYIEALKRLKNTLLNSQKEECEKVTDDKNVLLTLLGDKVMLEKVITKEADQVSLLSTLVTYIECKSEGMKEHSREYMDRVTILRLKIDNHYGEKSQKFCGS